MTDTRSDEARTMERSRTDARPGLGRRAWDQLISGAAAVSALAMIALGAVAIYGGMFGQDNVRDRLEPQNVFFPPAEAMSPEEIEIVGDLAGEQVDTGSEAEAYSRYIGLHLSEVNEGRSYAETSAAAREEGLDPDLAAELQGKADTLFRGETLRAILLNAYGWWTVSTLAVYAGYGLVAAGIVLGLLAVLGFRHARRIDPSRTSATARRASNRKGSSR